MPEIPLCALCAARGLFVRVIRTRVLRDAESGGKEARKPAFLEPLPERRLHRSLGGSIYSSYPPPIRERPVP